jgi:hypothetical protein
MGNHSLSVSRCGIYIGLFGIIEMNERIKQLQIQAEAAADEIFDRKGKMYGEIVMEKFAELIVRECAQVGFDYADGHCCEISAVILEHFGVEE